MKSNFSILLALALLVPFAPSLHGMMLPDEERQDISDAIRLVEASKKAKAAYIEKKKIITFKSKEEKEFPLTLGEALKFGFIRLMVEKIIDDIEQDKNIVLPLDFPEKDISNIFELTKIDLSKNYDLFKLTGTFQFDDFVRLLKVSFFLNMPHIVVALVNQALDSFEPKKIDELFFDVGAYPIRAKIYEIYLLKFKEFLDIRKILNKDESTKQLLYLGKGDREKGLTVQEDRVFNDVRELDLSLMSLKDKDIEFLRRFSNVIDLNLAQNPQINNISLISKLSQLKRLNLRSLKLEDKDIKFLSKFQNLISLNLSSNQQITDIAPIGNCHKLKVLGLMYNKNIKDFSVVSKFKELESLYMSFADITNLDFLKDVSSLKTFVARQNKISDISSLRPHAKLEYLDLNSNEIFNLNSLGGLVELKELDLGDNKIEKVDALMYCVKLEKLRLSGNKITSIVPLAQLVNLEKLSFGWNKVEDISPLENLNNLTELHIDENPLSEESKELLKKIEEKIEENKKAKQK